MKEPSFTLGIEEEFLLVDKETRDLVPNMPAAMLDQCSARARGQQVKPEYLRSQIEIGTRICRNIADARDSLGELRRVVIDVAESHGLAPLAVSTHPFADWHRQEHTQRERYDLLTEEMQAAAQRLLICGMHVHVGVEDDELRIDLMSQLSYFLPHFLALSCSSPFWEGRDTGLRSYRLTVFDALPRTGIPQRFTSFADYRRHVQMLIDTGVIEDATKIWWDLRPSDRYPTLETRIMDVCTDVEDAVSIAALIVCCLRMLYRLRVRNQRWRSYSPMLISENRWRAVRYGCERGLIDFGRGEMVEFRELIDELLDLIGEDADALGCSAAVGRITEIAARGTSATRQLAVRERALAEGATEEQALQRVVDHLIEETSLGVD